VLAAQVAQVAQVLAVQVLAAPAAQAVVAQVAQAVVAQVLAAPAAQARAVAPEVVQARARVQGLAPVVLAA
jgi:hypothetical protein